MRKAATGRSMWRRHRLLAESARREALHRRELSEDLEARHAALMEDARQAESCARAARRDARLVAAAFAATVLVLAAFWSCVRGDPEPFPSLLNMPSSRMAVDGGPAGRR